jgi:hypothetical protein
MATTITAPAIGPITAGSHGPMLDYLGLKLRSQLFLRQSIRRGFTGRIDRLTYRPTALAFPASRPKIGAQAAALTNYPTPIRNVMTFSFILVMFVLPAAIIATAVLLALVTKDRGG